MYTYNDFLNCCIVGDIDQAKYTLTKTTIDINAQSDAAFRYSCEYGHIEMAEWLYNLSKTDNNSKVNINADSEYAFRVSCENGHKQIAEWLYNLSKIDNNTKININAYSDAAFRYSCAWGKKEVAEWLYNLSKTDNNIKVNINEESDYAFRYSCVNGHKEIAEWLYNLSKTDNNIKVNINAESDYAFRYSCKNGHKEIAEYLVSLCPDYELYELVIENDKIKSYKIIKLKDLIKDKSDDEIINMLKIKKENKHDQLYFDDMCYICLGDPNLKYGCNHLTCLNCMIQWNINENKYTCDLCKKPIEFDKMIYLN